MGSDHSNGGGVYIYIYIYIYIQPAGIRRDRYGELSIE